MQIYRPMEWNRAPRINPHIDGQLIFDKGAKIIQWEKKKIFLMLVKLDSYVKKKKKKNNEETLR